MQKRNGFHSYGEIQTWLEKEYNVQAAYQTVHGIVRYKLQSKLKVPRPVSTEANPDVQAMFKKKLTDLVKVMTTYFGQG